MVLWAFLWSCLQSPSEILKSWRTLFVFPSGNILIVDHMCTTRQHQLTGSMKHSTINLPLKVECSWSGLGVYLLVLDTLMILQILTVWWRANSEHPFLQTILNLTLERCQSSDSWMLVSLLPDLEVSDLEKSQSNHKSNGDNLSLCCLKLYHKWMLWVVVVFCHQRS